MPVLKTIIEDGHVVRFTFSEPWVIEDLLRHFPADNLYRSKSSHPVHTLLDLTNMRYIPTGWFRTRNAPALVHPNSGYFVVVGITPYGRQLLNVILRIVDFKKTVFVETTTEALECLRSTIQQEASV